MHQRTSFLQPNSNSRGPGAAMKFPIPVKIVDQTRISPSPPAVGETRPALPLTFFDLLWIRYDPVERLFFYPFPHPTSHFLRSYLPKLKSSLSIALSTFYPLAANIRRRSDGRYEISPEDTDSVQFTALEYIGDAADFLDISGDQPWPVEKLVPLAPRLPESLNVQPLLAIQVTVFPNNGLCLALTVHHSACDGFSSMQFVKLWAALASRLDRSAPNLPSPVMDRTVIPDPRNLYAQMEETVLGKNAEKKKMTSGFTAGVYASTFTLSASELGRLKKRVQGKAAEQGMSCFHCSSFVVACAYAWICLLKTNCITDKDGAAHFVFAVDWRRRIRPPIPANYYGNCIGGCFVKCKAEELLSEDGILSACAAIGQGIDKLGDDVHENMDNLAVKVEDVAPWRPLSLAGSPKLGVYEVDFGWGRPGKVEVISTRETGALALAESRDGGGGIELGIILPEKNLNAFTRHFTAHKDW